MNIIDNLKKIKKLDSCNVLGSIESLGLQCQQAWEEVKKVKIPKSYKNINNVVISGMGGSGLGGHIIQCLFFNELKVPVKVLNSYDISADVNSKTLFIASSYSGNTEETLRSFKQALARKAKVMAITADGQLAKMAKRYKIPVYVFEPRYNPCGQPRLGLGYSIIGQIALFKKAGILNFSDKDLEKIIKVVINGHHRFGVKIKANKNQAKKIAIALKNKIPIIFGSEFLLGNTHVFSNQLNENAKNFATYFAIPELNHHLMEGLTWPKVASKLLEFLFIESDLYLSRNQARYTVTKKVIKRNGFDFVSYKAKEKTKIEQSFEILLFGSYISFYLALLNNLDPAAIPWVDYFKKELAKF